MKKLLLLVALVGGLGLVASTKTAEAGPGYGVGYRAGYGYHGGFAGYRYGINSYPRNQGFRVNYGYPRTYGGSYHYVPTYVPVHPGCNY